MRFAEAYKEIKKYFGIHAAFKLVVFPRILNRIPGVNICYNNQLRNFLRKDIKDIIEKYKHEPLIQSGPEESSSNSNKLFSLWWQGLKSLPEVVELCHNSLNNNIGNYELIELDKDNISNYIDLPYHVLNRLRNQQVSITNFSDIVRTSLLAEYGGGWIDACLYVVKPLQLHDSLDSPRFPDNNSPNGGKWCLGVLFSPKGHKLMRFMRDSLFRYWEIHDKAIDFLMMDSFMMIAYEEFDDVRAEIDKFIVSSPDLHRTRYLFDKKIDKKDFERIIEQNDFLSLTWRIDYPDFINGEETYYKNLKNI